MHCEVAVIGAGFAGLTAADSLIRAGREVALIEARDRVGGQTLSEHHGDGLYLETGGQWIAPGQDRVYSLIERFQRPISPAHKRGHNLLRYDGRTRRYRGCVPGAPLSRTRRTLRASLGQLERLAKLVPPDAPWQAPNADFLDQMSLGDWLRAHVSACETRWLLKSMLEAALAAHPDELSLLHALLLLRSGGGPRSLLGTSTGARQDRIDGGAQKLAMDLAAAIEQGGGSISCNDAVSSVERVSRGVFLRRAQGVVHARRVIVAVPPALCRDISFRPLLPVELQTWQRGMNPGRTIKCFAVYERPFWRDGRLSGSAINDQGPLRAVLDDTPPDCSQGVLCGYILGRDADHWLQQSAVQRQAAVLDSLGELFGTQASRPLFYHDKCWVLDHWSRGGHASAAAPGLWSGCQPAWQQPFGPVHWAGSETSSHWNGYIEGAIRSGERAAAEVDAALARPDDV